MVKSHMNTCVSCKSSQDCILLAILRILCGWVLADHHWSQAMKLGPSASVVEQWQLHLLPSPSHWWKSVPRFLKSYLVCLYLFKISVIVNRWFVVIISTLLLCKTRLLCSATLKGPWFGGHVCELMVHILRSLQTSGAGSTWTGEDCSQ